MIRSDEAANETAYSPVTDRTGPVAGLIKWTWKHTMQVIVS
jgi:hypothetical protein